MPVHRETRKAFEKAGYSFDKPENAGGGTDRAALQMVPGINHNARDDWDYHRTLFIMKDCGRPIEQYIDAAKRIIDPKSGKEFVVVYMTAKGSSYSGEEAYIHWTERGLYELPVFRQVFDGKKNRWTGTEQVTRAETVYEYPFAGLKTKVAGLLDEDKLHLLTELERPHTKYHCISNTKTPKLKISRDDFYNLSHEEIIKKYYKDPATALQDIKELLELSAKKGGN